jgi:hypothetical protein
MSATSNKSRMLILVMIAISLVFFMASFVAASISSEQAPAVSGPEQVSALGNCIVVQTGERILTDCSD